MNQDTEDKPQPPKECEYGCQHKIRQCVDCHCLVDTEESVCNCCGWLIVCGSCRCKGCGGDGNDCATKEGATIDQPQPNTYRLTAYIGEMAKGEGYTEMEYNPYEEAVIFRDKNDTEIWLEPACLDAMAKEIEEFAAKIRSILT